MRIQISLCLWASGLIAGLVACNNSSSSATPPSATPEPDPAQGSAPVLPQDPGSRPGTDGGNYDPCQDKSCGDRCTLCAPSDPDCMETAEVKACDPQGECLPMTERLCADAAGGGDYDPCKDKSCGDRCSVCPPDDQDCVETMVIKTCSEEGKCTSETPTCEA